MSVGECAWSRAGRSPAATAAIFLPRLRINEASFKTGRPANLPLVSAREKNAQLLDKVAEWLKGGAWKGEVALGLVDARNTKLENAADLKKRIAPFAQAVPAERLWVSPNCGLEFLPHEAAVKKLKVLREAAQAV